MRRRTFRRKKRLAVVSESDNEPSEDPSPYTSQNLRLGIVRPGQFVEWASLGSFSSSSGHALLDQSDPESDDEGEDELEDEVERDFAGPEVGTRRVSLPYEDDMLNQMKIEIKMEKKVASALVQSLKEERAEWESTHFTLVSPEGKHGDGELIRLLFAVSGTPLIDCRVTEDEWETMKETSQHKTLPILSKCGVSWSVTEAIVRMLSKKFGLLGSTNDEHLVVDATYERLRRVQKHAHRAISIIHDQKQKNKEKLEWAQGQLLHVVLPPCLKEWEQQIHLTDGPFIVTTGMTMADIAITDFLHQCAGSIHIEPLMAEYLAVSDLITFVKAHHRISVYMDEADQQ